MISVDLPERIFAIAWAFQVAPEHRAEFECAYGPNGDWVRLFRSAEGYIKTELHRDRERPGTYVTLDFWCSRERYESFKQHANAAYKEIDARCESLTRDERLLGEFDTLTSLRAAFPNLGALTEVRSSATIRAAVAADIPAIIAIERSAPLAAHWNENAYAAKFAADAPPRIMIVAENENQRLCGFLVARVATDECELENIVVAPQQVRRGVGSGLLQHLIRTASERGVQRIFLEVRESNHDARRLYQRAGFIQDGCREGYYAGPSETAVLYSLLITGH